MTATSKAKKKRRQILETAIKVFAKEGVLRMRTYK